MRGQNWSVVGVQKCGVGWGGWDGDGQKVLWVPLTPEPEMRGQLEASGAHISVISIFFSSYR